METIVQRLRRHEGFQAKVYTDSRGNPTIGIGHKITVADKVANQLTGHSISIDQALLLLREDLALALHYALRQVRFWQGQSTSTIPPLLQDIVTEMAFVLGPTGLAGFHRFGDALFFSNWAAAAEELRNSLWATEVPHRVKELADLVESLSYYPEAGEQ